MFHRVALEQQDDFHFAIRFGDALPVLHATGLQHPDRALAQFEAFCTVGESVRQGIPVDVEVCDSAGARLK
jgi:hypothetical protein